MKYKKVPQWKNRPAGFLAEGTPAHDDERLNYIYELHEFMWALVRKINPSANGDLKGHVSRLLTEDIPEQDVCEECQ